MYTKGPWKADISDTMTFVRSSINSVVCEVFANKAEEENANARLIAVAPELLEALQGLMNEIFSGQSSMTSYGYRQAQEAIAKAEDK